MIERSEWLAWTAGLTPEDARRALLVVGMWPHYFEQSARDLTRGTVAWDPGPETSPNHESLTADKAVGLYKRVQPNIRLGLNPHDDHRWVIDELLKDPKPRSVIVNVSRPRESLRRRPWRWPLRVGTLGISEPGIGELSTQIGRVKGRRFPRRLLSLRRVEDGPGAHDVLVVAGPIHRATEQIIEARALANAVVIAAGVNARWPLVRAQIDSIRAATSASIVVIAPAPGPALSTALAGLVWELSHAQPIDVALANAFERKLLMVAEPDVLDDERLPKWTERLIAEAEPAVRLGPPPLAAVRRAPAKHAYSRLTNAVYGAYAGEEHEANTIALAAPLVLEDLQNTSPDRRLQCEVSRRGKRARVFSKADSYQVAVWIGPLEEDALAASDVFPDAELPWEQEEAEGFRLTVVFAPTHPIAEGQSAELFLPRFGTTSRIPFVVNAPAGSERYEARIIVLFRNRVLQTAVLSADRGAEWSFGDWVGVRRSLGDLDDRQAFDASLVLNHTGKAGARAIATATGKVRVTDGDAIEPIATRLADRLDEATDIPATTSLNKAGVALLIELAIEGKDLFETLKDHLGDVFGGAQRIQILQLGSEWMLPLELVYDSPPPRRDRAVLCPVYKDGADTCTGCPHNASRDHVCPNGFWGMSKTIERLRRQPSTKPGYSLAFEPRPKHKTLRATAALFAAYRKVPASNQKKVVTALHGVKVDTWQQWEQHLEANPTDLLVLLPHADIDTAALFIGKDVKLSRGEFSEEIVTGGRANLNPLVVLFGCRTTGTRLDPAGFAPRFISMGAGVVFTSLTMLRGSHAAELARRLGEVLLDANRPHTRLSTVMLSFRRDAVRAGLVEGLAVNAYGDGDCEV